MCHAVRSGYVYITYSSSVITPSLVKPSCTTIVQQKFQNERGAPALGLKIVPAHYQSFFVIHFEGRRFIDSNLESKAGEIPMPGGWASFIQWPYPLVATFAVQTSLFQIPNSPPCTLCEGDDDNRDFLKRLTRIKVII